MHSTQACLSSKHVCQWILMWENNRGRTFSLEEALLWIIMDAYFGLNLLFSYLFSLIMDLFLTNMQVCTSQDIIWWPGLLWCFYQQFELLFWWHPFTADDLLVSKWCNAKILRKWFMMKKQADLHLDWHLGELIFRKVLFLRTIPLKSKKRKHFRFFFCSISGLQLLFWSVLCNAPLDPSCAMISKACHVVAPPKHPKEIPECSRKWVFGKLLEDMLFPTSHPGFVSIAGLSLEPARHLLCQTQWGRKRKSLFCSHVATVALYTVEY